MYQTEQGREFCLACLPGFVSDKTGNDKKCHRCPIGQYQSEQGKEECTFASLDAVVMGGMVQVQVPLGSYKVCHGTLCNQFSTCPAGWHGFDPPNAGCAACEPGMTSFSGSTRCRMCSKGRFSNQTQSKTCTECETNTFQHQDSAAAIKCTECPLGWAQPNKGQSLCVSLGWKTAADCSNTEYLNNTSINQKDWTCVACPSGGACQGETTIGTLPPLFGWWPVPVAQRKSIHDMFAECLYHPACLGLPNIALENKYFAANDANDDLAKRPFNSTGFSIGTCNVDAGFRNHSSLCHTCKSNFRRRGADRCAKCPDSVANWGFMALGMFIILAGLIFIAGTAIASAGKQELSESVQKILLNYLQVAAMIRIFPLRWPAVIEHLFDFQGAFSTVGDHLVNPDCVTTSASAAELFYSKQAFFSFLPFLVTLLAFVFWYVYGLVKQTPFFDKRDKRDKPADGSNGKNTTKDYFVVTVGAILYLLFPTLVSSTFQLFDCRTVGNGKWLHADMEESCNGDRYQWMVLLFGISQLVLYVGGLPLLLLWFLIRNHDNLQTHAVRSRYGLFFAAYKQERFYWEIVLSLRKIIVTGLGVFGPLWGVVRQTQVALLVLSIFIVVEIVGDPFKESSPRHKILARLESSTLIVLYLTMWSGTMIFSSAEANDTASVEALSLFVVLIAVVMMAWLVIQMLREIGHEKSTCVAQLRYAVVVFCKKIRGCNRAREIGTREEQDDDEEDRGADGIERGNRKQRRLSSRELMRIEMTELGSRTDSMDTLATTKMGHWKKIKQARRASGAFKQGGNERAQRLARSISAKTNPMVQLNHTGAACAHRKTVATATRADDPMDKPVTTKTGHWKNMKQARRASRAFKQGGKERAQRLARGIATNNNPALQLNCTDAACTQWKTVASETLETGSFKQSGKRRIKRLSKIIKSREVASAAADSKPFGGSDGTE
jgi:hypothetical protein